MKLADSPESSRCGSPLGGVARAATCTALAVLGLSASPAMANDPGVSEFAIQIGGVMDQEGSLSGLSASFELGITQAFADEQIQGRTLEFVVLNDGYEPAKAVEQTKQLIDQGIFLMVGNVGTPTAAATLPVLAEAGVPAVGFFTGAGLLRPGVGSIVNYRASYTQEVAATVRAALAADMVPNEICAFLQNDAFGMAAVAGINLALEGREDAADALASLARVKAMPGTNPQRNFIGPVGVYTRNTFSVAEAYDSLKNWERTRNTSCKMVVSAAANRAVATFAGHAQRKGETWLMAAVSFTGSETTAGLMSKFGVREGVLMTQVVPSLDSTSPVVDDARTKLGAGYDFVSLEGFLVGRMVVEILRKIEGPITRTAFLDAVYGRRIELGGVELDFQSDNQGSDLVIPTKLQGTEGFVPLYSQDCETCWVAELL